MSKCSLCALLNATYTLECQHTFHPDCIFLYLLEQQSCPECRAYTLLDLNLIQQVKADNIVRLLGITDKISLSFHELIISSLKPYIGVRQVQVPERVIYAEPLVHLKALETQFIGCFKELPMELILSKAQFRKCIPFTPTDEQCITINVDKSVLSKINSILFCMARKARVTCPTLSSIRGYITSETKIRESQPGKSKSGHGKFVLLPLIQEFTDTKTNSFIPRLNILSCHLIYSEHSIMF